MNKLATNTLMAGRYAMMSDLYRFGFEEPCLGLAEIGLAEQYQLQDRRIEAALRTARAAVDPRRVVAGEVYCQRDDLPFVFLSGV